jgi:hypothetical protein
MVWKLLHWYLLAMCVVRRSLIIDMLSSMTSMTDVAIEVSLVARLLLVIMMDPHR